MNKTTAAALTLTALTALSGVGILVHGSTAVTGQDGTGVTSPTAPRTVVMAEPSEPLCAEMLARCAPIPPAPWSALPEGTPLEGVAAEYSAAWAEVKG